MGEVMHYIIPAALSAFVLTGCGGGTSISENKLNDQPSNSSDGITPDLIYPNSMDDVSIFGSEYDANRDFMVVRTADENGYPIMFLWTDREAVERHLEQIIGYSIPEPPSPIPENELSTSAIWCSFLHTCGGNVAYGNKVLITDNITETNPDNSEPRMYYVNAYSDEDYVSMAAYLDRYSNNDQWITTAGAQFDGMTLTGVYSFDGRSWISRLDNNKRTAGTFNLNINMDNAQGNFSASSNDFSVIANSVILDKQNGTFNAADVVINYADNSKIGQLDGKIHGQNEATSGLFYTKSVSENVVGSFAGARR